METTKLTKFEKKWQNNFEFLKEYIEEKNCFPSVRTEYKGVRLGKWLIYQKQAYEDGKLSTERIDMLKSVGVNLDIGIREEGWLKNYGLLKEYIKVEGQLPKELIEYEGVKLGLWLKYQRQAYDKGILSAKHKDLLNSFGVKLDIDIRESRWLENYELLKEYIEIEERLPKELTVYKGVKLGMWIDTQERAYRDGKLLDRRRDMLCSIGVDFDTTDNEKQWLRNYDLLKEYIEEKGDLPNKWAEYKCVKLGSWLCRQKRYYREGNLLSDRENMLRSIGIKLNVYTHPKRWLNNYELLKEYVTEKGDLPAARTEYKGVRLGRWLIYQKQIYNKGNLSSIHENMLRSAGVEF